MDQRLSPRMPSLKVRDSFFGRNLLRGVRSILGNRISRISMCYLIFIALLGIFGPLIAPYEPSATLYDSQGQLLQNAPPSYSHPLGTTFNANDVFSRVLVGARPTVITGFVGGTIIITLGLFMGVTSGYYGGTTDEILMRLTDLIYGVPLIPFALVLVTLFGIDYFTSIVVIGLILWRGSARVLRSQVLQIKEQPYIMSAKTSGASSGRIIVKHILPNIAPMAMLFFAIGVGASILIQAGLTFIGVTDPTIPSWGIMLRNAHNSGMAASAWWWSLPPGIMISSTVMATYMLGRAFESKSEDGTDANNALIQGG